MSLAAALAILKRRKKRFDAILAPDERWAAVMRRLGWAHHSRVLALSDTEALERLWSPHLRRPAEGGTHRHSLNA